MIYTLLRNLLFLLPPETAHTVSMKALHMATGIPSLMNELIARQFQYKNDDLSSTHFGLHFPNPVGLGAGFDKNAEHLDILELLGFGFVEMTNELEAQSAITELHGSQYGGRSLTVNEARPHGAGTQRHQ